MTKIKVEVCPVCGKTDFVDFIECVDFYASQEKYSLQKCVSCGFVFTQLFPSENEIGRYYEVQDYVSHTDTKKGIVNYIYHYARGYMLNRKAELVKKESGISTGRLLDYGCGTGYFLNSVTNSGWSAIGLEKSSQARSLAVSKFSLDVFDPAKIETLAKNSFDVITLWHVMEHIENLNEMLVRFNALLKPGGKLIVAVPNCKSYDAMHYHEYWAAYDVPRHLWHFDIETVKCLMQKNGFELMKTMPMPLDAFYISMLSEKYKKGSLAFVRGMLVGAVAFLSALGDKSKSSSIIYVLKKTV